MLAGRLRSVVRKTKDHIDADRLSDEHVEASKQNITIKIAFKSPNFGGRKRNARDIPSCTLNTGLRCYAQTAAPHQECLTTLKGGRDDCLAGAGRNRIRKGPMLRE